LIAAAGRSSFAVVAAALLVSSPGRANEALSGVFSDITMSAETGDLGGLEIELHAERPNPYALVVSCEGWCGLYHRVPLRLTGTRFSFAFSEQLVDSSGKPAGVDRYRIDGRLVGRMLVGSLELNTQGRSVRRRFHLQRRARQFGLSVARPASAE